MAVGARRRSLAGERQGRQRDGRSLQRERLGAPEHQLAACGAALLSAWAAPGAGGADWRTAMERHFPGTLPSRLEWDPCRTAVVRLWDAMHMGGVRTAWDEDRPETAAGPSEEP